MKLVLIHTDGAAFGPLAAVVPPALLPLLDKPVVQHQIELGYAGGLREIAILASNGLDQITAEVGGGERFGVSADLRIGAASGDELASLRKHRSLLTERLLVVTGLHVPLFDIADVEQRHAASGRSITLLRDFGGEPMAAILDPAAWRFLGGCEGPLLPRLAALAHQPGGDAVNEVITSGAQLTGRGLVGLLKLNRFLLRNPSLLSNHSFEEEDPGVFLGRNVMIHGSATIRPPVLVGDHCQIMAGATVGPDAVVGERTVIARRAEVSRSLVAPGSYVGELLRIDRGYSIQSKLFHEAGSKVIVTDRFLLGRTTDQLIGELLESATHRGVAAGLLALLSPIFAVEALRRRQTDGDTVTADDVLGQGDIDVLTESGFLPRIRLLRMSDRSSPLAWYPALVNVLRGEARLVGPRPLDPSSAKDLPGDWAVKRFKAAPGLLGLPRDETSEEETALLAETIYAERRSAGLDVRILLANLVLPVLGHHWAARVVGI